jgi:hypothetical protein
MLVRVSQPKPRAASQRPGPRDIPAVRLAVLGVVAAVIVACGPSSPRGLPTHRDLVAYPAATLTATLKHDGGCIFAVPVDGGPRELVVWPHGYGLAQDLVMVNGRPTTTVGARVILSGGEYQSYAQIQSLLEEDIPEACRGGPYWLVSTFQTVGA